MWSRGRLAACSAGGEHAPTQLPLGLRHSPGPCHVATSGHPGISVTFCTWRGLHSLSHCHLDPHPVSLGRAYATATGALVGTRGAGQGEGSSWEDSRWPGWLPSF